MGIILNCMWEKISCQKKSHLGNLCCWEAKDVWPEKIHLDQCPLAKHECAKIVLLFALTRRTKWNLAQQLLRQGSKDPQHD